MTTLTFQNTTLSVINKNNQIWLSASELAKALGYKQVDSVTRIYNRNTDEFSENMTALVKNPQAVNLTVRIFSLRGCHLIGMLSHTKVAKDFRKWVLDILDRETQQPKQLALPTPEKTYSRELTERQWLLFASMWFALYNNLELLAKIHKPLEMLGSRHGVTAYTHATEYQTTLGVTKRLLEPMLAEFNPDPYEQAHYHLALKTLREYQPQGLGRIAKI